MIENLFNLFSQLYLDAAPTVSSKNKTKPQIRLNAAKEANPLLAEEKAKKQEEEDQLKAAEMVEEQKAKLIEEEKRAKEAEEANRLMAEEKARKEEEDKANEVKKVTKMPKLLQLKRSESPKFDTQVTEGSSGTIIEKNNNIEEVKEHLKDLLNNKQVPVARRVNTI